MKIDVEHQKTSMSAENKQYVSQMIIYYYTENLEFKVRKKIIR